MNHITQKILERIAVTKFVQKAIMDQADLSAFKERPTPRAIMGIAAIGISYIIGWPAVALLSAISIYFNKPMIALIGGPITYGLSHLVFILGMYLAGAEYTGIFVRWATKAIMEKLLRDLNTGSRERVKKRKG